jgi:hypothetical protein
MPNAYPPDQGALDVFSQLRRMAEEVGRDPAKVGIEVWVSMGLEAGRRLASMPDDDLQPPPPQAHPRPYDERPFGGACGVITPPSRTSSK